MTEGLPPTTPPEAGLPPAAELPPAERQARRPLRAAGYLFLALLVVALVLHSGRLRPDGRYQTSLLMGGLSARIAGLSLRYEELAPQSRRFAEQALESYLDALRLRPDSAPARAGAAVMYGYLGRRPEAAVLLANAPVVRTPAQRGLHVMWRYYQGERPTPYWANRAELRAVLAGVPAADLFRKDYFQAMGRPDLARQAADRAYTAAWQAAAPFFTVVGLYLLAGLAALALVLVGPATRWWGRGRLTPPPWGAAAGLQAMILFMSAQLALALVLAWLPASGSLTRVTAAVAAYVGAGIAALLAVTLPWRELLPAAGWQRKAKLAALRGLGGWAVLVPFVVAAGLLNRRLLPDQSPISPLMTSLSGIHNPVAIALLLGMIVLLAPIVEETLFRGILHGGLRRHWRMWPAALVSGLLFAAMHMQPGALLPLFALGTGFAILYERSGGSLVAPMTAHAVFNAVNAILLLALR